MSPTRRQFLAGLGGAAAASALAGCGFVPSHGDTDDPDTLTFTTWGTPDELAGFRTQIARFEKAHPGRRVALNAVPYDQMFPNLDAQLQAGYPPDIFRVPYYTLGSYGGRDQLLDLRPHLGADLQQRFTPTAWAAVQSNGRPVGVPHHTDTTVLLYNKDLLKRAGVTPPPRDRAWTWQQFSRTAAQLRDKLPDGTFPFVSNWQGNGVTRWLSWVFQADGRFLDELRTGPAIESAAARAALDFTKSFFAKRYVPPDTSVKSTALAADVWLGQTAAMTFGGAFLLPDAKSSASFAWDATLAPRDVRSGSDFGGNALVATARTKKPALAASFLEFMTRRTEMHDFCVGASLLPTRRDLADGIRFKVRPELTDVFLTQSRTVRPADAAQVASPSMIKIITVLQDQLEDAFVGGQSTRATLAEISDGITEALR